MPYPTNADTASSLEKIIRSHGAVPATIALIDGKVHVGLSQEELYALGNPETSRTLPPVKVSRRDLAPALSGNRAGGTTVAGTMVIAHSIGISSFVTGGIGGVHRGAQNSMDVSADLIELGRTPMMVVCAGAKSILDIPLTLEVLETQGVCVAAYSQDNFPAFYSPSSGCKAPWSVDSINQAAELAYTGLTLPSPQSTLLAVPIPAEYSERGAAVQAAVEQAVRESVEQGIDRRGKEVTPWLLARVGELTKGTALELNIKLIENNAHVGAQVARQVARLAQEHASSSACGYMPSVSATGLGSPAEPSRSSYPSSLPAPKVVMFGAAAIDLTSSSAKHNEGTTTPGSVSLTPGGVARNIAHAAQNLLPEGEVLLVSPVGTAESKVDAFGEILKLSMAKNGLRTDGLVPVPGSTAVCSLLLGGGHLVGGVADMSVVEHLDADTARSRIESTHPDLVVFDTNVSSATVTSILSTGVATLCDPTSVPKTSRLVPGLIAHPRSMTHLCANAAELDALYAAIENGGHDGWEYINSLNLGAEWRAKLDVFTNKIPPAAADWIRSNGLTTKMVALLPWVASWWVKAGEHGLLRMVIEQSTTTSAISISHPIPSKVGKKDVLRLSYYPPPEIRADEVVSTTGAGDTLAGGLAAGIVSGQAEEVYVAKALQMVGKTLRSELAVV